MPAVISADGTRIGDSVTGIGPTLVHVGGALMYQAIDECDAGMTATVLAWLAGRPSTPTAAAVSEATTIGEPVGQETATPTGMRPARPSPAGEDAS